MTRTGRLLLGKFSSVIKIVVPPFFEPDEGKTDLMEGNTFLYRKLSPFVTLLSEIAEATETITVKAPVATGNTGILAVSKVTEESDASMVIIFAKTVGPPCAGTIRTCA